jgi:hypothetical protein
VPDDQFPTLTLASGEVLELRQVMLYPAEAVLEIAALRAQALKSFGGVSTGIGFWGSPSWALGGAAALGLLEGVVSAAMKNQGAELLSTLGVWSRYVM